MQFKCLGSLLFSSFNAIEDLHKLEIGSYRQLDPNYWYEANLNQLIV